MATDHLSFCDSPDGKRLLADPPEGFTDSHLATRRWMELAEETYFARLRHDTAAVTQKLIDAAQSGKSQAGAPAFALWAADNCNAVGDWDRARQATDLVIERAKSESPILPNSDLARTAHRTRASIEANAGNVTEAIDIWRQLFLTDQTDEIDAENMLLAGRLALQRDDVETAVQIYETIADDAIDSCTTPQQVAVRALAQINSGKRLFANFASNRHAVADAISCRDSTRLDALLSNTHFSMGTFGGHFHFADATLRERVLEEILMHRPVSTGSVRGSGNKRYEVFPGFLGDLLRGSVGLFYARNLLGWELTGVVLSEPPKELVLKRNQPISTQIPPLQIRIRAPWPAGEYFRAGGLNNYIMQMTVLRALPSPWDELGKLPLAQSECGFGPGGLYYNDIWWFGHHNDEDAFAIDFVKYRKGIPDDNVAGGTKVLACHYGVVDIARDIYESGDGGTYGGGNLVAILHPHDGDNQRYMSRYAHLAGKSMLCFSKHMPVITGAVLGKINDTGNSAFDHLHFSIHDQTIPTSHPSRKQSVRPSPMDGQVLSDSDDGTCVLSHNVEVTYPYDESTFIRQLVPSPLLVGQTTKAQLTFFNSGSADWPSSYLLQPRTPALSAAPVQLGKKVKRGQEITIEVDLVASTAGDYTLQWQLYRPRHGWFGQTSPKTNVTVTTSGCRQLQNDLNELEGIRESLQELLHDPVLKNSVKSRIDQLDAEINAIRAQQKRLGCP